MDAGPIFVGWLAGLVTSWAVAKVFAARSSRDLDDQLGRQTSALRANNSFVGFERMLRTAPWRKEWINERELWVCERNALFQFCRSEDRTGFAEAWTSVFPDQNGSRFYIHLMINGTIVRSLPFVSGDGGRYTLPLPDMTVVEDTPAFCWYTEALDVRIAEIIGEFYRYDSIAQVAKFTKVELVKGHGPDT